MRICSGFLKNRPITLPKQATVRPTSSKLRSAVCNICQQSLEGARMLDLFCGSGAMGIEAISRGASSCTFVDHDRIVLSHLKKTLSDFGITDQSTIIYNDVLKFLKNQQPGTTSFSLIYIDPPYTLIEPLREILILIKENLRITTDAALFLEVRKGAFVPDKGVPFPLVSKRTYSDSDLWHFSNSLTKGE